jgi:hypothetical protein
MQLHGDLRLMHAIRHIDVMLAKVGRGEMHEHGGRGTGEIHSEGKSTRCRL